MTRVAIVTGSNKGIGFTLVKKLCERFDGIIYLTARNPGLGQAAVKTIKEDKTTKKLCIDVKFHQLDVCSEESVQAFKSYIWRSYNGIDILINNAGMEDIFSANREFNLDLATRTLKTNVIGLMRVTNTFLPLLRQNGRIVQLGSMVGMLRMIPEGDAKNQILSEGFNQLDAAAIVNDFIKHAHTGDHESHGYPKFSYMLSKALVHALTPVYQKQLDKMGGNRIINAQTHRVGVSNAIQSSSTASVPVHTQPEQPGLVAVSVYCPLPPSNVPTPQLSYPSPPPFDPSVQFPRPPRASPGFVATDLNKGSGPMTPDEGAEGPLRLALLQAGTNFPKGQFCDLDSTVLDWRGTHPRLEALLAQQSAASQ